MDIKTLSSRTAIPVRQIRYVLDHKLVPERTWFVDEHAVGRARAFDEIAAVFIACAAFLLDAGYKRESVRELLTAISKIKPTGRNPLNLPVVANIVTGNSSARVQYGDGRFVRWITSRGPGEWIDVSAPGGAISNESPKVIVEMSFSEIRDRVRGVWPATP